MECVVRTFGVTFASSLCFIFVVHTVIVRHTKYPQRQHRAHQPDQEHRVPLRNSSSWFDDVLCVYMPFNSFNNLSNATAGNGNGLLLYRQQYGIVEANDRNKHYICVAPNSAMHNYTVVFFYLIRNESTVSVEHLLLSFHCFFFISVETTLEFVCFKIVYDYSYSSNNSSSSKIAFILWLW